MNFRTKPGTNSSPKTFSRKEQGMRFIITAHQGEWRVADKDTHEFLMQAEILDLTDVTFAQDGKIYARIWAAWGITLLDDHVSEHPYLLRSLGIARTSRSKTRLIPIFMQDGDFICAESNRLVYDASVACLIRSKIYYGRGLGKGGVR
jgi:hypothetical protein